MGGPSTAYPAGIGDRSRPRLGHSAGFLFGARDGKARRGRQLRRPQERRCNPAVYTAHDAGQIVDQTAPFARLTAHALYPEQWSRRMYVWNPKVTTAAPAYIPTTNIAQRGMGRILYRALALHMKNIAFLIVYLVLGLLLGTLLPSLVTWLLG